MAILLLQTTVKFSDFIQAICLHTEATSDLHNPEAGFQVSGWGATENNVRGSNELLYAKLPPVTNSFCERKWKETFRYFYLRPNQICAGGAEGTDSCTGDSGGPLAANVGGKFYLSAVVSYGTECASGLPAIYSRVSEFYPFLQENMMQGKGKYQPV
jgi:secreted trypsin-like serine protease